MIIAKDDLPTFLDGLLGTYQVFVPLADGGESRYVPLAPGGTFTWQGVNTRKPPKEILFPQSEVLYSYEVGGDRVELREHFDKTKRVVFGIRPCDARSFLHLDRVFLEQEHQDPYYRERRENAVMVGMACLEPASTCFCTSLGGGPFAADGLDLLFIDLGDRYLVRRVTPRGEALLREQPALFRPAGEADRLAAREAEEKAKSLMSPIPDLSGVKPWLDAGFGDPLWDRVYEKCIGCAVCTYLCPTCHCFDLTDEAEENQCVSGVRIRTWDTCAFPLFTLHASGHNPRPTGKERFRQRVMHKFRYFVENWGEAACVGCGRCIINCPVNLDIREVLREIMARAAGAGVSA
ncbi:MAG: 4Fe-4S dicluster domain-containing protein [Bacillota bacterium]